jgi:hypothetical protein
VTAARKSCRDVFLTIALAVARDGLPEPRMLSFQQDTPNGDCVHLRFDSHADGHQWGKWIGDTTGDGHWQDMHGVRSLSYWNTDGPLGWFWNVDATEPLDAPPPSADELAQQVASAILTPADDLPSDDSKIWACPHEGCGYHVADGPIADGEVPTDELIRMHLEEHEPRCPEPECGEPLALIEAGLVGHCGRGCGAPLADGAA